MSTYKLPFIPQKHYNLDNTTLALNATQKYEGKELRQYDVHSLYGHM